MVDPGTPLRALGDDASDRCSREPGVNRLRPGRDIQPVVQGGLRETLVADRKRLGKFPGPTLERGLSVGILILLERRLEELPMTVVP